MNQPSPFNKNANKSNVRNFSWKNPVPGQTGIKGQILEIGTPMQSTKFNPNPAAPKVLDWWDDEKTRPKMQVMVLLQTELNAGPDEEGNPDDGRRKIYVTIEYKPGGQMAAIQDAMAAVGADDLEVGAFLALWFTGYDPESANPDNPRRLFQASYQRPAAGGGAFQAQQQPAGYEQAYGQPAQAAQQQAYGQPQPYQQQQGGGFHANVGNGGFQPAQQQPPAQQAPVQQFQQPPAPQQQQQQPAPQQVEFTTQGPVNTGTGEIGGQYPAPQPQQVQVDVDAVRARIAQGMPDQQIAAETGASLEVINALRNLR